MGILCRIRNLVSEIARKFTTPAQPAAKPAVKVAPTVVQPARRTVASPIVRNNMHPSEEVFIIGGVAHPVFHEHGNRRLAHIKAGNLYVPLSAFKKVRR